MIDIPVPLFVDKTVLSDEPGLEQYGRGVLSLLFAVDGLNVADVGICFSFTAFVLLRDFFFVFCFAMTISNFNGVFSFILLISLVDLHH